MYTEIQAMREWRGLQAERKGGWVREVGEGRVYRRGEDTTEQENASCFQSTKHTFFISFLFGPYWLRTDAYTFLWEAKWANSKRVIALVNISSFKCNCKRFKISIKTSPMRKILFCHFYEMKRTLKKLRGNSGQLFPCILILWGVFPLELKQSIIWLVNEQKIIFNLFY